MPRTMITDHQWIRLKIILLQLGIYNKHNLRRTLEGILFRLRTGISWRELPSDFGHWTQVYRCFLLRWSKQGKITALFKVLQFCPDKEWLFIDGSYVKVHQYACNVTDKQEQGIGKSIGGNTTKIHLMVDACGNPVDFIITGGQVHDVKVAPMLIEQHNITQTKMACADKGYDCDKPRDVIRQTNTKPNIPKRCNSKSKGHPMDWYMYKTRHLVENNFAALKQFRAIATRLINCNCAINLVWR